MMQTLRGYCAVLLVLWIQLPLNSAHANTTLTERIEDALVEENLVGATWALVTPEGTELGAAGLRDVSTGQRLQPQDRVQVGSVAKTLLAVGILRLVTEGLMALDDPVAQHLPDLRVHNPWSAQAPLRVRHLLDHTGGLDDARLWQVFTLRGDPDAPLRDGLAHQGAKVKVHYPPGRRFSYSNTGYLLLGMLIEAVTSQRYEDWLSSNLLTPLGMTQSSFAFITQRGPQADSTLAMGHFDKLTPHAAVPIPVRPASQFTTTAEDMARFARFLMSDGKVQDKLLVDASLLRAMAQPSSTEAAHAGLAVGYALGLARRDRHGVVGNCHLGNIGTFRAALCVFPTQQKAFFIAHNTDFEQGNFGRIDQLLVDALELPAVPIASPQTPSVDPTQWDGLYLTRPVRFQQFAYLDELAGVVRVRWDGSVLWLKPLFGPARALAPAGGALFQAEGRREPSHVLLQLQDQHFSISDGLRTLDRVVPARLYLHWANAAAGAVGLLYLLLSGGLRSVRALRRGHWSSELLRYPALCLILLLLAPLLYLSQPMLAIGDATMPNVVLATLTAALPCSLLWALWQQTRCGLAGWQARGDVLVLVLALQWCAVLAYWGLLPLVLWR